MADTLKPSKFNHFIKFNPQGDHVLYNAGTGSMVLINESSVETVKSVITPTKKDQPTDPQNVIQTELSYGKFLIPNESDEVKQLGIDIKKYLTNTNKSLNVIIAPSMECNFGCVYCYESTEMKASTYRMSQETQDQIVSFVEEKLPLIPKLFIEWYGGEPLIGIDIIESLSKRFMNLAKKYNTPYSSRIVTNASLLTEEKMQKLIDYKVTQMIVTLDGVKEIHDTRRILKGGQGTFNRIMKSIELAADHINITVRINVDTDTKRVDDLMAYIKEQPFAKKITLYLADLHLKEEDTKSTANTGCGSACSTGSKTSLESLCLGGKPKECAEALTVLDTAAKTYSLKNSLELSSLSPKGKSCTATDVNGIIIGPHGEQYMCPRDIGDETLVIGHIKDFFSENKTYSKSYENDPTEHPVCKTCDVLPLCLGGCRKRALDLDTTDCKPIKFHINQTILRTANEKFAKQTVVSK